MTFRRFSHRRRRHKASADTAKAIFQESRCAFYTHRRPIRPSPESHRNQHPPQNISTLYCRLRRTRKTYSVFTDEACPAVFNKTLCPFRVGCSINIALLINNFDVFCHGCHPLLPIYINVRFTLIAMGASPCRSFIVSQTDSACQQLFFLPAENHSDSHSRNSEYATDYPRQHIALSGFSGI